MPTPATGWSVADQVTHLADVDDLATLSATAPEALVAERHRRERAALDTDAVVAAHRHRARAEVVCWFDEARAGCWTGSPGCRPTGAFSGSVHR